MSDEKVIYIKKCKQCGESFKTDKKRATVCPMCKKHNKSDLNSYRTDVYPHHKKTLPSDMVGLYARCREIDNYNKRHNKNLSYGQYESLKFLKKI